MSDNSEKHKSSVSGDLLFAALFILLSLFLLSQMPDQVTWVEKAKWATQPGFWPLVSLTGMVGFGALHLLTRLRFNDFGREWAEGLNWLKGIEFAVWFMVYVWIVPIIGYLLATLIFAPTLAFRMGYRSGRILWSAVALGFGTVFIFKTLLQVKIPGGAIYEYLPNALRSFMIVNF